MTGDETNILGRIKALLPFRWFPDSTPVLDALLSGVAWALSFIYSLIQYAKLQTRIATATDGFLDLISFDFFGTSLLRRQQETDTSFRGRITATLLRAKGTRAGMIAVLQSLTGRTPIIFEAARPADTGGWGIGCSWGSSAATNPYFDEPGEAWDSGADFDTPAIYGGGWGSLRLTAQAFVIAFRPAGQGIPNVAGWGASYGAWGGGYSSWSSLKQVSGAVTDSDIYAAVAATKAAGTRVWTQIQS